MSEETNTNTQELPAHVQKIQELKSVVEELEKDSIAYFEKGKKKPGVRIRKACQFLKSWSKEYRALTLDAAE